MRARRRTRAAPRASTVHFDEEYYRRYYVDPRTRIYDQVKHAQLVAGVVSLSEWFAGPLSSVLDVGAGVGLWKAWLESNRPGVEVLSTELEADACRRYGHLQADLAEWRAPRRFDLVVCQGVLPYLPDARARAGIGNLAAMCGGLLYVEAITKEDLRGAVDLVLTDVRVFERTAAWYRRALAPHFLELGAGLWAARDANLVFYALEAQR